jgi:Lipopolysaccharide kinase (Kdo/WaaP) family
VPVTLHPPSASQRVRPPAPAALLDWGEPSRSDFLRAGDFRRQTAQSLRQAWSATPPENAPTASLAALLAHLEPVPFDLWSEFVALCMAARKTDHAQNSQQIARHTWLEGYQQLRCFHFALDRRTLQADRASYQGPHPALWRLPAWSSQAGPLMAAGSQAAKIKAHKRGVVCRIDGPQGHSLILKHFPPHKRYDPRNRLGLSKAIFSLHAAEALNRRGLRAAVPYAAWSRAKLGAYMIMEDLAAFVPLQQAVIEVEGRARAELLASLATFSRRMHLLGVAYRDFKPSNILVDLSQSKLDTFALIDHDRNRFRRGEIRPARVRRDLAALHAGLPPVVRASERLRALRLYGALPGKFPCNWGYPGNLWDQQIPKLMAEAQHRNRVWQPHQILGGGP